MAEHLPAAPESRVLRVFLSSTFRDFMEERDRLVKEVFPELRRKARERGVEVVEVDLRWGITEEESRQGKVLPICLAEIQRCRPYFVGMLGERYGWVPPDDDDNRVVLADQAWVEEHLGHRSVTELEILHGVLRNPEMAGRAFFYFRDTRWSRYPDAPGYVCKTPEEEAKLADLKQRIRDSGFPLVQDRDLPNPKALADRIGADLWALIEEQFPELDQPDALEREERKHASYRRSRTELYEDGGSGGGKVSQLEKWIAAGEERILITGDSGAGKSALIANWMQRHQQQHPGDVVFAHHLGCSNDANALEPMLARMVQAASKLMADELSEPIKVPQDYWELVSTVTDTLSKLSYWCKQQGRRWIWVLDGLDRLPEENQQALPWLPLQLFPHLHVVISALDSAARTILQEREYTTLTIGPLKRDEQKALIANYMRRYNKTLVPELEAKILKHEPARSPLFLRVVLDELRVCGRHEILAHQLDNYLKAQSVDALYAKVVERLEADVGRKPVQKVMTALWASRAGLSESELLAITKVKPMQWAPIDLGLEGAFGRNGERLVFDHNYLRQAVKARYLSTQESQREAHNTIAIYFESRDEWDIRDSEELPWQLIRANRIQELRDWLVDPTVLESLAKDLETREVINFWSAANCDHEEELDEAIKGAVEAEIASRRDDPGEIACFLDVIADLLQEAGLYREVLIRLRMLSVEETRRIRLSTQAQPAISTETVRLDLSSFANSSQERYSACTTVKFSRQELVRLECLAETCMAAGDIETSQSLFVDCVHGWQSLLGWESIQTFKALSGLASSSSLNGLTDWAEVFYGKSLRLIQKIRGKNHPDAIEILAHMAVNYRRQENHRVAEQLSRNCCKIFENILGKDHFFTLSVLNNLGVSLARQGKSKEALICYEKCLEAKSRLFGRSNPGTLAALANMGRLHVRSGNLESAKGCLSEALRIASDIIGMQSMLVREAAISLLMVAQAENPKELGRSLFEAFEALLEDSGLAKASTYECIDKVAEHIAKVECFGLGLREAEELLRGCIASRIKILGSNNDSVINSRSRLANLLSEQGRHGEAIRLRRKVLAWYREAHGDLNPRTLISVRDLADNLETSGDQRGAEPLYRECLAGRIETLGDEHPATMASRYELANCLSEMEDYDEAIELRRCELAWCRKENGDRVAGTLDSISSLADDLEANGDPEAAETLYREGLAGRIETLGEDHPATMVSRFGLADCLSALERYDEAIELRRVELAWCQQEKGADDPDTLASLEVLARDLYFTDEVKEAESLYRHALKQTIENLGADHAETMGLRYGLARCLSAQERYEEAIELRKIELPWHRETLGDRDPITLISINGLASDLEASGSPEAAETLFRECLAGRIEALGAEHPDTMASRYDLAGCLSALERYDEAIELRRIELAWCQQEKGLDDPETVASLHALGVDLLEAGQLEEGLGILQDCLNRRQQLFGEIDHRTLATFAKVLDALSSLQRYDEAIAMSETLQRSLETDGGNLDSRVLLQLSNQGQLYEWLERYDDAERLWRRCLEGNEQTEGPEHPTTIQLRCDLARVFEELGNLEEAEDLYRQSLRSQESLLGIDDPNTLNTALGLAGVLTERRKHSEGIPLRRRELAWCRQQSGELNLDTLDSINGLAIDLREVGELEEAEALFRELLEGRQQILEPDNFDIGRALGGLAKTLEEGGKLVEALSYRQQALTHRLENEGPDDWWTNRERLELARVLHQLGRDQAALDLLEELMESMNRNEEPDDDDRQLASDASVLTIAIEANL